MSHSHSSDSNNNSNDTYNLSVQELTIMHNMHVSEISKIIQSEKELTFQFSCRDIDNVTYKREMCKLLQYKLDAINEFKSEIDF